MTVEEKQHERCHAPPSGKGGFPLFAEATHNELACTRWPADQFLVIADQSPVIALNEHRPSWYFKQRAKSSYYDHSTTFLTPIQ